VAANNLANMNTVGFKREQPVFREYVEKTDRGEAGEQDVVRARLRRGARFQPGRLPAHRQSARRDDRGQWLSAVQAPDGSPPIRAQASSRCCPPASSPLPAARCWARAASRSRPARGCRPDQIGKDGTINGPGGPFGRLTVTVFDEATVDPRGDGMFNGTGAASCPRLRRISRPAASRARTSMRSETTDMVEILRAYQTSQNLSESMSDMRKSAIDRLGRVG
jgi:flagellar basal-body rod protein FlgF